MELGVNLGKCARVCGVQMAVVVFGAWCPENKIQNRIYEKKR